MNDVIDLQITKEEEQRDRDKDAAFNEKINAKRKKAEKQQEILDEIEKHDFLKKLQFDEAEAFKSRALAMEEDIADGKLQLQQFYVEGRIDSEAELNQAINEMTLDRYNEELNLLNQSSDAHLKATEAKIKLEASLTAEKERAEKADAKAKQEENKRTQDQIQNIILHSATAKEAFSQLLSMKINEILLNAMSSLWEDGSIPFIAKVGLAVGMKALVTPMIESLLGGGGGSADSTRGETVEVGNQFANGGLTNGGMFEGNSHANGGVKFRVGGRIHEAEGGEAIINKKSTSMFRPVLSAINSYNGNGVKFADGGLLNSGEKFAMGGELRSAQQLISGGMGSSKVVIVESDMTDVQNRISAIESQATF